jgi:hypothetical protein
MMRMGRRCLFASGLGGLASAALPAAVWAAEPALALLSGHRWPGTRVTYGFPQAGFRWEYSTSFTPGFVPANDTEKALCRRALQEWAAASGGAVSFVETAPRTAQIRLAVTRSSLGTRPNGGVVRGWGYNPGSSARAGDMWLHVSLRTLGYANGRRGGWVVRHEVGHALGLKHPHEGTPKLSVDLDCAKHTVMTYRTYCGDPTPGGWPDGLASYPYTLGDLDGWAVRLIYAPSETARLAEATRQLGRPRHDAPRGQE